jgi:hypothetical protein
MEKIELTPQEIELLERIEKREFDPDNAPVEEQDLEIALLDKAAAFEDTDEALVDERLDYTRDSNLLIWFYYRYKLQEGKCEKWNGKTTKL